MAEMLNKDKYINAILYFLEHINNTWLGKTKLMKLLYYLDFDFYEQHGRSITGDTYVRWELGPIPRNAERILEELAENKDIHVYTTKVGEYDQTRCLSLREFDVSVFTSEEYRELERVAQCWENFTATDMVKRTHREIPYRATEENQTIDYDLAYYRNSDSVTEEDRGEAEILGQIPEVKLLVRRVAKEIEEGTITDYSNVPLDEIPDC